jgi:GrpB-like predicted nucleotidyltransferase (UPF0157 family)
MTSDPEVFFQPELKFRAAIEERFETIRRRLRAMIPTAEIEHVGSTAVPGSLTKGDLDVQLRVTAAEYPAAKDRLCRFYDINRGGFAADDAISFDDHTSEPHTGIHLTVIGGSADFQWRFRDALISSETLRSDYDDLKRRFQGKSMAKYREAKDRFVKRVLGELDSRILARWPFRDDALPR